MGYVYVPAGLQGTRALLPLDCLLDSGAHRNYLPAQFRDGRTPDDIGFHTFEGRHDAILADERIAPGYRVRFPRLAVGGRLVHDVPFVVLPHLARHAKDAILGAELLQQLDVRLRPRDHAAEF